MVLDERSWVNRAINIIESDFNRSADTHLIKLDIPVLDGIDIYLKDESTHITGSLKHRLARSLFLYGLCNGYIKEGMSIVESSSGSTAISEAYFAKLLGLPFFAVVPKGTSKEKIEQIEFYDGKAIFVEAKEIYSEAKRVASELNGYYMDQFTYAEVVTDWRGNNNIAQSIFEQMSLEKYQVPTWVVVSAGTGGTSATIGRYIRYKGFDTKLCVADPENSVFYDYYKSGDSSITTDKGSNIEGIGRPRVEPSFLPSIVDEMIKIDDSASFATIHFLDKLIGKKCGGSTGTNVYTAFMLAQKMQQNGVKGSIVTLICDSGDRYLNTYYNRDWLNNNGFDIDQYIAKLDSFYKSAIL